MPGILHIDFGALAGEVRIWFDDETFARSVAKAFGGHARVLLANADSKASCDHVISGHSGSSYSLDGATGSQDAPATLGLLDSAFDTLIRSCTAPHIAAVHASAVEVNGRAVAIAGTSGTGKTTLSLACGISGIPLIGDEFGFLGLDTALYSHALYPLCVRDGTWRALGAESPADALPIDTPYGGKALMCSPHAVPDISVWGGEVLPLGAIIVPYRKPGAKPRLRRVSVADWPKVLMPSVDASVARDELFRSLVHLFAAKGISVLCAEYDTPGQGVSLVGEVARYF